MTDPIKRLNYFNGQFLRAQDFTDEQTYHMDQRRRHNRSLHTWGIASGLTLSFLSGATRLTVGQGTAIDGQGREIVLPDDTQTQDLSSLGGTTSLFVTIAYGETPSNPVSETGATGNTRMAEIPTIGVSATAPADPSITLIVGRVAIDAKGVVQSTDNGTGTSVRRTAGAVGGDLNVVSLNISDPGVVSTQWPRFTATTAGRVDLQGSLKLTGGLETSGDAGVVTDNLQVRRQLTVDGTAQLKAGLKLTGGLRTDTVDATGQLSVAGQAGFGIAAPAARVHVVNTPTDANGATVAIGPADGSHLRLGYHADYSWVQSHGNKPLALNPVGSNVGIGTTAPQAQLQIASDLAVGPFATGSDPGRLVTSGPFSEIGFVHRGLKAWPTSPQAGDKYVWYNQDGLTARLWTPVVGDLLTVSKAGDLWSRGTIRPGTSSILYAQTSGTHNTNNADWAPIPGLALALPVGSASAVIILNLPFPFATGNDSPGGTFAVFVDGVNTGYKAGFTYSSGSAGRMPTTLVLAVRLKSAPQKIEAYWQNVRGSNVIIDSPASLTAIIA